MWYTVHGVEPELVLNASPAERIFYEVGRGQYREEMSYIVANGIAIALNAVSEAAEKEKRKNG